MTLAEPIRITRLVIDIFEKLEIPYFIVGSLASSLYGIPRATADVDIIADIKPQQVELIANNLKNSFYVDEGSIKNAIKRRSSFNVIHLSTMFKVDIFQAKNDVYSQEEMARRTKHQLFEEKGQDIYLASAEDIILSKILWYQNSGCVSDRQWNDVIGVLRIAKHSLDFSYLQSRAEQRGIKNLLEKAIDDSKIT